MAEGHVKVVAVLGPMNAADILAKSESDAVLSKHLATLGFASSSDKSAKQRCLLLASQGSTT